MAGDSEHPSPRALAKSSASPDPDQERDALARIALASVFAGLCPAIPIPFLDDLALRFFRRRAIVAELARTDVHPGRAQLDVYFETPTRMLGCVTGLVIYPLKKIFKKLFIFLAVKDCVDAASQTFHELWMIRHAARSGRLSPQSLTREPDGLLPVRRAVEATAKEVDTSPVTQTLRKGFASSKTLVREAGKSLGHAIRAGGGTRQDPEAVERAVEAAEPQAAGRLDDLASRLGDQMWAQRGYLSHVESTFDHHFVQEADRQSRSTPGS